MSCTGCILLYIGENGRFMNLKKIRPVFMIKLYFSPAEVLRFLEVNICTCLPLSTDICELIHIFARYEAHNIDHCTLIILEHKHIW